METLNPHHSLLIFCERTGGWASAWRRVCAAPSQQAHRHDYRLLETRSPPECREAFEAAHAAFVAIELAPSRADAALDLLWHAAGHGRSVAAAVLASRDMQHYEWLARELGAVHFLASPRRLAPLCQIVERHFDLLPPPEMQFTERVWSSLPWAPTTNR